MAVANTLSSLAMLNPGEQAKLHDIVHEYRLKVCHQLAADYAFGICIITNPGFPPVVRYGKPSKEKYITIFTMRDVDNLRRRLRVKFARSKAQQLKDPRFRLPSLNADNWEANISAIPSPKPSETLASESAIASTVDVRTSEPQPLEGPVESTERESSE